MKRLSVFFLALGLLMLSGCGLKLGSEAPLGGSPAFIPQSKLSGTVFLGVPVAGASVAVQGLDGATLFQTVSGPSGDFMIVGGLPPDFRILARPAGSNQDFAAEVRGMKGRRYQPINILTTLASLYLRQHPGASLGDAESKVRQAFNIPTGLDLGYGIEESPRGVFSHVTFLRVAGQNGGWAAFSAQILQQLDGSTKVYSLTPSSLKTPITGLESGLQEIAEQARTTVATSVRFPAGVRNSPLELAFDADTYPFLFGVAQGVTGNLITGIPGALGTLFNLIGFKFTTSGKLSAIQSSLTQVQEQLSALLQQEQDDTLRIEVGDLDNQVNPIHTTFTSYIAIAQATVPVASPTPSGVNTGPFTAPGAATGLASFPDGNNGGADLTDFLVKIGQYMLGLNSQPNIVAQSAARVAPKYGLDQQASTFNLPLRDNNKIGQAQTEYGIYRSYQVQGLLLLAENCHTYSTNISDPVNMTVADPNSAVRQVERVSESLKAQGQQVPIELPSSDVIVDLEFGVMWYKKMFAADSWEGADDAAYNLVVQGTGADGSVITYDDWRLPTYAECKALQSRGRYNPAVNTAHPPLRPNSNNGYGDTGLSTNGLYALGFTNMAGAWKDSQSEADGSILYASWTYTPEQSGADHQKFPAIWTVGAPGFFNYGAAYQPSPPQKGTQLVFKLNHESKNQSSNTGPQPYFVCRSILNENGLPVLNPTEGASLTSSLSPSLGLPWDTNPVQPGEYPCMGVVTNLTAPYAVPAVTPGTGPIKIPSGALQLATGVTCEVTLGGQVTLGKGSQTQSLSLQKRKFSNSQPILTINPSTNLPNLLAELIGFRSANPSQLFISNIPKQQGLAIPLNATNPVQVTVQCLSPLSTTSFTNITNSANITPAVVADHSLVAIQIAPRSLALGAASLVYPFNMTAASLPISLTAFYADGTMDSLASSNTFPPRPASLDVVWTITPASAATQLQAKINVVGSAVTLSYNGAGLASGAIPFNVTASYQGLSDTALFEMDIP